jgi:hypothetical protein
VLRSCSMRAAAMLDAEPACRPRRWVACRPGARAHAAGRSLRGSLPRSASRGREAPVRAGRAPCGRYAAAASLYPRAGRHLERSRRRRGRHDRQSRVRSGSAGPARRHCLKVAGPRRAARRPPRPGGAPALLMSCCPAGASIELWEICDDQGGGGAARRH